MVEDATGTTDDPTFCPSCKTTSKRNLVVCIDGTSNQFGARNTNIVELYNRLIKDKHQRTFYNSGIGTYAKPHGLTLGQWFANKVDLAIAWRFDQVLLSAYRWLSENYEEGDRIFLFGFSRGAYQVRALSAMIQDVGLIHKGNQDQIPFAYQLYSDPQSRHVPRTPLSWYETIKRSLYRLIGRNYIPSNTGNPVNMAERFKSTFSRENVKVHFVGAWDTVSSVGIVYSKTLPGTTSGMSHVCTFRHALAIHERRVKFLPEFVGDPRPPRTSKRLDSSVVPDSEDKVEAKSDYVVLPPPAEHTNDARGKSSKHQESVSEDQWESDKRSSASKDQPPKDPVDHVPDVKEVWFAGSHSDIGGGNMPNMDLDQFGPTLRWMSFESIAHGLRFKDEPNKWEQRPRSFEPKDSLSWFWWLLELWPLRRLSFANKSKKYETIIAPHLGAWRRAWDHQRLHETALDVIGHDKLHGKALNYIQQRADQVDQDEDSTVSPSSTVNPGLAATSFPPGPNLREWPDLVVEFDPYREALSFLKLLERRGLGSESDVARLETILRDAAVRNSIRDAIQQQVDHAIKQDADDIDDTKAGTNEADDNRFSTTGGRASRALRGKWGRILMRILAEWTATTVDDSVTGRAIRATLGLSKYIDVARVSFNDSAELSSLAAACAKRDPTSLENLRALVNSISPAEDSLRPDRYLHAAFHPDGSHVVIGAAGTSLEALLWDFASGSVVNFAGVGGSPSARVTSIAVSPDGTLIALSLAGSTVISAWNHASPHDPPVKIAETPASARSQAFNPDGTRLVIGCSDGSVVLADVRPGQAAKPLDLRQDSSVWDVAWSGDGKYIASGSKTGSLCIWDAETLQPTFGPSATGFPIHSLAFSPDGTQIATGGGSGNVRLWNLQSGSVAGPAIEIEDSDGAWVVCFSQDGKYVASSVLEPDRVRVWSTHTGAPLCEPFMLSSTAHAVMFDLDSMSVRVTCEDGTLHSFMWSFGDV